MTPSAASTTRPRAYRHDALFYDGADEFHASVSAFLADAMAAGEPTLVVASAEKIEWLRDLADADMVQLADMGDVGRNPARIIPKWRAFVDSHPSTSLRGVGEPITTARGRDDLVEAQHMEALLNVAFAAADDFWLRCPYDIGALDPAVVDGARRSHPFIVQGDNDVASDLYEGPEVATSSVLDAPLPEPLAPPVAFTLRPGRLKQFRTFVAEQAAAAGLEESRVEDLVLAANEIASNSLLYAGGGADVRIWRDHAVVCEVRDAGVITDPFIGRVVPGHEEHDPRGLWMVNQVCDIVQVRSSAQGSVVRLHVHP
ncbi:MAG TPA: sensor histidine kinase [Euzebyales bacterium]|nr:sensor histidine kinase [Euzebyales bacterium]